LSYVKIILNDTNAVKPNFFNFIVKKKKNLAKTRLFSWSY